MVILGGLEIVIGGAYVYHRRQKKKRRLEQEAEERRSNSFSNEKSDSYSHADQLLMVSPFTPTSSDSPQHAMGPTQKYACYAPQSPHHSPQSPFQPGLQQAHTFPRRPLPPHAQSHPVPGQTFPQLPLIQPLGRSDSFSTLSNMPVANGSRPGTHARPQRPTLLPIPQHQPYNNQGFNRSTSAIEPQRSGPYADSVGMMGRGQTVDDNWETYGPHSAPVRVPVAQRIDPEAGEDDPPPAYQPQPGRDEQRLS